MQSLIDSLREDHRYMTRLLHQLEAEVSALDNNSRRLDTVLEITDYLKQYPELWHHPVEESLFARLLEKPLAEHERGLVSKVIDEHAMLDALAELVDIKLAQYLLNPGRKASLMRSVNLFVRHQLKHIECEQNHVFRLCRQHLDDSDWQALVSLSSRSRTHNDDMPVYHRLREKLAQAHWPGHP